MAGSIKDPAFPQHILYFVVGDVSGLPVLLAWADEAHFRNGMTTGALKNYQKQKEAQ